MVNSEVGMESVATVVESSDLLGEVLLLLDFDSGVAEDLRLVLGVGEAHVVCQVSDEFSLTDVVLLVEIGLFLLEALKHGLVVGSCIG